MWEYAPAISPDGTKVVFTSQASNLALGTDRGGIFLKDVTTGEISTIYADSVDSSWDSRGGIAFFSPDGTKIAFMFVKMDVDEFSYSMDYLMVRDVATGTTTEIASILDYGLDYIGEISNPAFSPDSTKISYHFIEGETDVDLHEYPLSVGFKSVDLNTGLTGTENFFNQNYNNLVSGNYAAFSSTDATLVPGDTNGAGDVFITALLSPSENADFLSGTDSANSISGLGGNDTIRGWGGNDTIFGDAGNDVLRGDDGDDLIEGGAGNDDARGGIGNDKIFTREGDDKLYGGDGNDTLYGGLGNDTIRGEAGDDTISGEDGAEDIKGGDGADFVYGGLGNDIIYGEAGNDSLRGNEDNDKLYGGLGADDLRGGIGNDKLYGEEGIDYLRGEDGNDLLDGGAENDRLGGDGGNDTLYGGIGNDALVGNDGNDQLFGNEGVDTLTGGAGKDGLTGGAGADIFRFLAAADSTNALTDRISDFENGVDRLDLDALGLAGFSALTITPYTSSEGEHRTYISAGGGFKCYLAGDYTGLLDASDFLF